MNMKRYWLAYWFVVSSQAFGTMAGKLAPDFVVKDQKGVEHILKDYQKQNKTVVLEWTNSNCPYVVDHYERKTMVSTYEALKGQNVVWLAVNSTHYNKPEDSKAWQSKWGFEFATLQDPAGVVGKKYNARTTPHMIVIDSKGTVRYDGAIDDDPSDSKKQKLNYVAQAVSELNRGAPVSVATTKPYGCSVKYKK